MLLDLALIPKVHKLLTDQDIEETQTKPTSEHISFFYEYTGNNNWYCDYFIMFVISELKDEKSSSEDKKLDDEQSEKGICHNVNIIVPFYLHFFTILS